MWGAIAYSSVIVLWLRMAIWYWVEEWSVLTQEERKEEEWEMRIW